MPAAICQKGQAACPPPIGSRLGERDGNFQHRSARTRGSCCKQIRQPPHRSTSLANYRVRGGLRRLARSACSCRGLDDGEPGALVRSRGRRFRYPSSRAGCTWRHVRPGRNEDGVCDDRPSLASHVAGRRAYPGMPKESRSASRRSLGLLIELSSVRRGDAEPACHEQVDRLESHPYPRQLRGAIHRRSRRGEHLVGALAGCRRPARAMTLSRPRRGLCGRLAVPMRRPHQCDKVLSSLVCPPDGVGIVGRVKDEHHIGAARQNTG